jgi:hypothetical protein
VNAADRYGQPLLLEAVRRGNVDIVNALIANKADVNAADQYGFTPLHTAGRTGHSDMVKALVFQGANLRAANGNGDTPLFLAAEQGYIDIVKFVVEMDANVNGTTDQDVSPPVLGILNQNGFSVLHAACMSGSSELVDWLISRFPALLDSHLQILEFWEQTGRQRWISMFLMLTLPKIYAEKAYARKPQTEKISKEASFFKQLRDSAASGNATADGITSSMLPALRYCDKKEWQKALKEVQLLENDSCWRSILFVTMYAVDGQPLLLDYLRNQAKYSRDHIRFRTSAIAKLLTALVGDWGTELDDVHTLQDAWRLLSQTAIDYDDIEPLCLLGYSLSVAALNVNQLITKSGSEGKCETVLHLAIRLKSLNVVKILALNSRLDPLTTNSDDETCFELAADNDEVMKVLRQVQTQREVTVHVVGFGASGKTQFVRNCKKNFHVPKRPEAFEQNPPVQLEPRFKVARTPKRSMRVEMTAVSTAGSATVVFRDFPGQEGNHLTHGLWFTEQRAVFGIFINPLDRREEQQLRYWLQLLCTSLYTKVAVERRRRQRVRVCIVFSHRDKVEKLRKSRKNGYHANNFSHEIRLRKLIEVLTEEYDGLLDIWQECFFIDVVHADCRHVFDAMRLQCEDCCREDVVASHEALRETLAVLDALRVGLKKTTQKYLDSREMQRRKQKREIPNSSKEYKNSPVFPGMIFAKVAEAVSAANDQLSRGDVYEALEQLQRLGIAVLIEHETENFVVYDVEWFMEECVNRAAVNPGLWFAVAKKHESEANAYQGVSGNRVLMNNAAFWTGEDIQTYIFTLPNGAPDCWPAVQLRVAEKAGVVIPIADNYLVPGMLPFKINSGPKVPCFSISFGEQCPEKHYNAAKEGHLIGFLVESAAVQSSVDSRKHSKEPFMLPLAFQWQLLNSFLQIENHSKLLALVGCTQILLDCGVFILLFEPGVMEEFQRQCKSFRKDKTTGLHYAKSVHRSHQGNVVSRNQLGVVLWRESGSSGPPVVEIWQELQKCMCEILRDNVPFLPVRVSSFKPNFLKETFCLNDFVLGAKKSALLVGALEGSPVSLQAGELPVLNAPTTIAASPHGDELLVMRLINIACLVYVKKQSQDNYVQQLRELPLLRELCPKGENAIVPLTCKEGVGVCLCIERTELTKKWLCVLRGTDKSEAGNLWGDLSTGFAVSNLLLDEVHTVTCATYFLRYARHMCEVLREKYLGSNDTVYLSGHSLGGAAAILLAVLLTHDWKYESKRQPKAICLPRTLHRCYVLTIGAPFVAYASLNELLAAEANSAEGPRDLVCCLAHGSDAVPRLLGNRSPKVVRNAAVNVKHYSACGAQIWLNPRDRIPETAVVAEKGGCSPDWAKVKIDPRDLLRYHRDKLYTSTVRRHLQAITVAVMEAWKNVGNFSSANTLVAPLMSVKRPVVPVKGELKVKFPGNRPDTTALAKVHDDPDAILNESIKGGSLCELRTHLRGMGSHEFWVDWTMAHFLPNISAAMIVNKENPIEDLTSLMERYGVQGDMRSMIEAIPELKLLPQAGQRSESERIALIEHLFTLRFTTDVVYTEEQLLKALLGYDPRNPDTNFLSSKQENLSNLAKLLSNLECGLPFEEAFRPYIIFNIKKVELQHVYGITNTNLLRLMEYEKPFYQRSARAKAVNRAIRNCFRMLNADGAEHSRANLSRSRGNFTPQFYPMRFALKDAMYQQYPEVLSFLLNTALHRYRLSGIRYVEFSVSLSDLTNERVRQFLQREMVLDEGSFWSKYAPRFHSKLENMNYYFLGAVIRTKAKYTKDPLDQTSEIRRSFVARMGTKYIHLSDEDRSDFLEAIFPEYFPHKLTNMVGAVAKDPLVVGMDIVGDGDGFPFSPITHIKVLNALNDISHGAFDRATGRRRGGRPFGVRLHGGESVKRGTSVENEHLLLRKNFAAHMRILYTDIKKLKEHLYGKSIPLPTASIRIGQGNAFMSQQIYNHGLNEGSGQVDAPETNEYTDVEHSADKDIASSTKSEEFALKLSPALIGWLGERSFEVTEMSCDFRAMRRYFQVNDIPIELNTRCNQTPVPDASRRFVGRHNLNPLSHLRAMLDEGLFVVIGTDDDGIWPIHKCDSHYSHISVASEVCNAIFTCNLTGAEVSDLLNRANLARFQPPVEEEE